MSELPLAELVRRFYDEAWNAGDDEVVDGLLAADFQFRGSLGDELVGRDAWRSYRDRLRVAIPDFHNDVLELLTTPDRAAVRLRCTGHVHGVLLGVLGRGQRVGYEAAGFFTCRGGQLSSAWVLGDLDTLRHQLAAGG